MLGQLNIRYFSILKFFLTKNCFCQKIVQDKKTLIFNQPNIKLAFSPTQLGTNFYLELEFDSGVNLTCYYYFSEDDHFRIVIVPVLFSRQLLQNFAMFRTIPPPTRPKILGFQTSADPVAWWPGNSGSPSHLYGVWDSGPGVKGKQLLRRTRGGSVEGKRLKQ